MLHTGLVSVTFRDKSPLQIIQLVKKAGLEAIEWGGDIHVPPGALRLAEEIGQLTRDAGLKLPSYGSYYHAEQEENFSSVLETARALSAKNIRVWAGRLGSVQGNAQQKEALYIRLKKCVEQAERYHISVSVECHGGTLTDTPASMLQLLEQVPGLKTYWQPLQDRTAAEEIKTIQSVAKQLTNIHVYHWVKGTPQTLTDGMDIWGKYIKQLNRIGGDRYLFMEFVKEGSESQFLKDAQTLKMLIREAEL